MEKRNAPETWGHQAPSYTQHQPPQLNPVDNNATVRQDPFQQPPPMMMPQPGGGYPTQQQGPFTPPTPMNQSPQQQQEAAPPAEDPTLGEAVGCRFTWQTYPNTKPTPKQSGHEHLHLPEMVVPLACNYTPLATAGESTTASEAAAAEAVPVFSEPDRHPPRCTSCGAIWSRHCHLDAAARFWACPCCFTRNGLPPSYSPTHPALTHNTVEYVLGKDPNAVPVFLFIVDTCLPLDDVEPLQSSLSRALEWLPQDSLVGFITFGRGVTLWEIGFEEMNKCYSLRGNKAYSKADLLQMLGIQGSGNPTHGQSTASLASQKQQQSSGNWDGSPPPTQVEGRFLCPLRDCEFAVSAIIDDLSADPFPQLQGQRPLRATGAAIELALSLVELLGGPRVGKLMLFLGGPCTRGPGSIVSLDKAEVLRSHKDFEEGNVPFFETAKNYYDGLEGRLTAAGCSLDAFIGCLDQVGLLEMRHCVNNSGGAMICCDMFAGPMFEESFKRFFSRCNFTARADPSALVPATAAFAMDIAVHCSSDTKVMGAVGLCRSKFPSSSSSSPSASSSAQQQQRKSAVHNAGISAHEIGVGGTTQWLVSSADPTLTFTIVFDTETGAQQQTQQQLQQQTETKRRFIQFVATFTTAEGERRVRVSSLAMPVAPPSADAKYFIQAGAFDQSCAAAVVSRIVVSIMDKSMNAKYDSTKRWLDQLLVRFVKRFGTFTVGVPSSLRLDPACSLFPMFVYNFRRSEYFSIINVSPDETTVKRHFLLRETTDNVLLMIQPTVHSYSFEHPDGTPAPLDSNSVKPDVVLLMDSYFGVHVLKGAVVDQWEKAKYHEREDMAHFKRLLEVPVADAEAIVKTRHPYPRYDVVDQYGSQARHVMSRLNPSVTQATGVKDGRYDLNSTQQQQVIYTDDSNISRFMETLKGAVVARDSGN